MLRNTTLFFVGAFGYGQIELLYRGYTHWTMLASGGVLLLVLHALDRVLPRRVPLLARCAAGAGCITGLELAMGLVCNRLLGMGIWDYSDRWGNLWGQICPRFSLYWCLLCIPVFLCFACADRLHAALRPA